MLVLDPPSTPAHIAIETDPNDPHGDGNGRARPPRIVLFTDTITDVNGVSRFVNALADRVPQLSVLACGRREGTGHSNIHIVPPLYARPMPGYADIDLAIPHAGELARLADSLRPDIVHVSTPGPVGAIGRRYALRRGLPLVGTFHTDFPAYIDRLLDDPLLTRLSERVLHWFYSPFNLVIARSAASMPSLGRVGIPGGRIACLPPGIDTDAFHPRHRDATGAIWRSVPGARAGTVKALYVGRVSVEKNLPMLVRLWPRVRNLCAQRGQVVQLIVVGDGPYLPAIRIAVSEHDTCFAGFRHGAELAALYASSDLFVFPSVTDTLGQAVMEAQASGLAAVVSDLGGPSRMVMHGRTGLVVSTSSDATWINAMVRLIGDAGERAAMGAAARARLAPMTIRASVERFVALHAEVWAKTQPGRALARGPARR